MYVGKAPLQAGQKLYLYKKVMESMHMILVPGALVCPKACRDSVILSQEMLLDLLALPGLFQRFCSGAAKNILVYSGIASHLSIGLSDHIDETEAGSCFSAVKEQTCQNCRTFFELVK